jgi:hypothetical protein
MTAPGSPNASLFNKEAIAQQSLVKRPEGQPLVLPRSFGVVLAAVAIVSLAGLVAVVACGEFHQVVRGRIVLKARQYHLVQAGVPGTVSEVRVHPGAAVTRGAVLIAILGAPDVRGEWRGPKVRNQHLVSSPIDGIVSGVFTRNGENVAPTTPVLSLVGQSAEHFAVGFVPASARAALRPGTAVSIAVDGTPEIRLPARIETVAAEAWGIREVDLYLGPDVASALGVRTPVVLLSVEFGRERVSPTPALLHGMHGSIEVQIGSQRMSRVLFPFLKR